jgi:hypothetical protein
MHSTLIDYTQAMCLALIAALMVSLGHLALKRLHQRLVQIAWPGAITIELRLTLQARRRARDSFERNAHCN